MDFGKIMFEMDSVGFEFLVVGGVAAFAVCLGCMPLATFFANKIDLLDHPSGRKQHAKPTPLVGGLVVFISSFLVTLTFYGAEGNLSVFFWLFVVLVVGVIDDLMDLSYILRSVVHLGVVLGLWFTDGLMVENIGAIFSDSNVVTFSLGVGLLFTAIAVIGAVNAVNMIDGVDGLLGSLVVVSLISLLLVDLFSQQAGSSARTFEAGELVIIIGALLAFLVVNGRVFGRTIAKIYMGDAGSTVLGFLLVYVMIDFSQSENPLIGPVAAGWILGLPLLDASAVILKRVMDRRSPVAAGRDHLHHVLLDRGFGVNKTVLFMLAIHVLMITFALLVEKSGFVYSDLLLFWGFVALVVGRVLTSMSFHSDTTSLVFVGGTSQKESAAKESVGALYGGGNPGEAGGQAERRLRLKSKSKSKSKSGGVVA
ncbi:hypothetical protein AB833_03585 [Chromatiales bacterium (ex Bugula neritina AB1)]|nr:hypothetical protein AB833_03585 [Chromatiales bacterium (ex Bugula neritina AB1)]